jgi:hypothetical protein
LFPELLSLLEQETTTEWNGYLMAEDSAAEIVNKVVVSKPTADAANGQYLPV